MSKLKENGPVSMLPSRLYTTSSTLSLKAFDELCAQTVRRSQCPRASEIISNVPIYDLSTFSVIDEIAVSNLQDEWYNILLSGAGVFVLRSFIRDNDLIDRVSEVFAKIIRLETENAKGGKGDHFAAAGLNSRIWNSFQKHALADPKSFVQYYNNSWLRIVSESWLGVAYQVTAQVNIVHPGGKPQVAHRDYHLGFQTANSCARFPIAMQTASQLLTLQGAVAHSNMPLASGPTRFLPFSQQFEPGYMAYRQPEFTAYFDSHWVSIPLEKGDAVFFNPALMHAAGQNDTTDLMRSANLLQISSAFGRPMEHVDSIKIIDAIWDDLKHKFELEGFSQQVEALIAAVGDGYPFPTNLDARPPAPGGMAPTSEQDVLCEGLKLGLGREQMVAVLEQLRNDSRG